MVGGPLLLVARRKEAHGGANNKAGAADQPQRGELEEEGVGRANWRWRPQTRDAGV